MHINAYFRRNSIKCIFGYISGRDCIPFPLLHFLRYPRIGKASCLTSEFITSSQRLLPMYGEEELHQISRLIYAMTSTCGHATLSRFNLIWSIRRKFTWVEVDFISFICWYIKSQGYCVCVPGELLSVNTDSKIHSYSDICNDFKHFKGDQGRLICLYYCVEVKFD